MAEEIEEVKIKRIGVLSLAGTFAIISMISGLLLSLALILFMPLISSTGVLTLLPFPISSGSILIFVTLGFGLLTFVSFVLVGLFYNLAAWITKGIKLYS